LAVNPCCTSNVSSQGKGDELSLDRSTHFIIEKIGRGSLEWICLTY
jgi:hypothetical protein